MRHRFDLFVILHDHALMLHADNEATPFWRSCSVTFLISPVETQLYLLPILIGDVMAPFTG
jgi:hypothetical protein